VENELKIVNDKVFQHLSPFLFIRDFPNDSLLRSSRTGNVLLSLLFGILQAFFDPVATTGFADVGSRGRVPGCLRDTTSAYASASPARPILKLATQRFFIGSHKAKLLLLFSFAVMTGCHPSSH
jgi:hypothetical protein